MSSIYYSAAWTECGCLISCWHEHQTVAEAASCIPCAGGYVVAVQNAVMRFLKAEEESQLQSVIRDNSADKPALDRTVQPAEGNRDSGYAVMTRIRVGDCWNWATWMRFGTYGEAMAHARKDDKVVRFRSLEWVALLQTAECAPPSVGDTTHENLTPRDERETLVEFVLRFLVSRTQDQP